MAVSPIFADPPELSCPVGPLQVWYTAPPGAVVQLTEATVFTRPMAAWLVGPAHDAFEQHFANRTGLHLVLDLRVMISREPAVRAVFMEAGARFLRVFSYVIVVQPVKPPPLYLVTLRAAAALLSAFGPEVTVEEALEPALERHGLRPESERRRG